ncbi:MAG: hypothetical protein L0Y55_20755, partial [Anaerolineales bacterium]|nr:hypothetical protein [Anaerolineales bacterium]
MREKRELSRAEIARQRRAQRAANELTQTGKRATTPIIQPVVTRRATPTVHKPTFVQVQKKRKFNIALGFPDFHLKRPPGSAQSLDRRWRIASLGIALVFGTLIVLAIMHPYFNIPSVTVLGNNRLAREEISNAAGVLGQSIFTVQP